MACLTQVAANYLIGQKEAKRWGTAHGSIVPYQVRIQQDCSIGLPKSAVLYGMSLQNDFLKKTNKQVFRVFCHISLFNYNKVLFFTLNAVFCIFLHQKISNRTLKWIKETCWKSVTMGLRWVCFFSHFFHPKEALIVAF